MKIQHPTKKGTMTPETDVEQVACKFYWPETAPSLKPGEQMMLGCCINLSDSIAIRESYRFRTSRATKLIYMDALPDQATVFGA